MLSFVFRAALPLWTARGKVFITVTDTAPHNVSLAVTWVLLSTKTFAGGIGSVTLTFPFKEG